jgi:hypothetical protein
LISNVPGEPGEAGEIGGTGEIGNTGELGEPALPCVWREKCLSFLFQVFSFQRIVTFFDAAAAAQMMPKIFTQDFFLNR